MGAIRRHLRPKSQAGTKNEQMATTELTAPQRSDQTCRQQLLEVGLMASKSLLQRYTVCADAGRHHDHAPPQRHGPYWQYSHKIERKTVTPSSPASKPSATASGSTTVANLTRSSDHHRNR